MKAVSFHFSIFVCSMYCTLTACGFTQTWETRLDCPSYNVLETMGNNENQEVSQFCKKKPIAKNRSLTAKNRSLTAKNRSFKSGHFVTRVGNGSLQLIMVPFLLKDKTWETILPFVWHNQQMGFGQVHDWFHEIGLLPLTPWSSPEMMTNFFRVHCVLSCGTMALRVKGIRQRSLLVYFLCIKGSMWKGTLFSSFCMCGSRSTTARANPGVYVLEGRKGNFQENTVGIGLIIRKSKEEKKTMLIYKK